MPKILRYDLDFESLGDMTSFKSVTLIFLIYFSIILRSEVDVTLLVVIIKLLLLAQIKLAKTSDLISLRILLMLETYLLYKTMNLLELPELIGTIICFLDGSFVIMLILGLSFFDTFNTFWTSSIFFTERLEKFSLIFIMVFMLFTDV